MLTHSARPLAIAQRLALASSSGSRALSSSALRLNAPALKNSALWKSNSWTGAASGSDRFDIINPGTGKKLGSLPEMGLNETQASIQLAYDAFHGPWGETTEYDRAAILTKLFGLLNDNAEDLAQIITAENGKPLVDARGEVTYGASFIEWFAGEAVRSYGDVIPSSVKGVSNLVLKQPIGVCGIVTPWNFPLAMVTRKIGAAIAAGCTSVIKAPSETPYTVLAFQELAHQAGVPKGVIEVILTDKNVNDVGRELCENPLIKKISLTGSTRVGKILAEQSSQTLKKMSMELGGNAPIIVFDDADLDKAVAGVVASKFRLSGQTCVCANRVFVQEGVYDKFADKLVDAVNKFKVGLGTDEGVTHGPLVHANAVKKVDEHVQSAKAAGARVLVGGKRAENLPGFFYEPTVLADVQRCAVDDEETFGPLAALYKFATEEEVIKRANEPRVGLAGYFFTENIGRLHRVATKLQVGMVGANTGAISQAGVPFGGVGESGYGREGSKYGLAEYQNIKLVSIGGL